MKKFKAKCIPVMLVAMMMFVLTACSSGDKSNGTVPPSYDYESDSGIKGETNTIADERKIIETISLTIQTREFDELLDEIEAQVNELGGYIESSSVSGREFGSSTNRHAKLEVRIPSAVSDEFTAYISENSAVVSRNVSTEDITLKYVDMESRVNALEAEKTALEAILEQASTVSEVIEVRDKLTSVIYEIESYKSQLKTYDNLVEYTTITMDIDEVEKIVVTEEKGTWERIGTNLVNNFVKVWKGLRELFIFFVSTIPFMLPFGVSAAVALIIIHLVHKAKKKKRDRL